MSDKEGQFDDEPPPQVGDIRDVNGLEMQVMRVSEKKGVLGWLIEYSAEPVAQARGYRKSSEALGFVVEHFPPSSAPRGNRREASQLVKTDWDFRELLKKPLRIRCLALFHELMRESARLREVCRIYDEGLEVAKQWDAKERDAAEAWMQAEDEWERLNDRAEVIEMALLQVGPPSPRTQKHLRWLRKVVEAGRVRACQADNAHSFVRVSSGNGQERFQWKEARDFLFWRLDRFPDGTGCIETGWIARDLGWMSIHQQAKKSESRREMALFLQGARKWQEKRRNEKPPAGLREKDVRRERPRWPFDQPVQVADEWRTDKESDLRGRPSFHYNSGLPGLPEIAWKGNGKDAERILSESVDLCVCFNFRDEEIVGAFETWLKKRRASLHDDLADFRVSDERPQTRMKSKDVNAVLLGIAALRLRARFGPKKGAITFHELYSPESEPSSYSIGNTQRSAKIAVRWQQDFLRYCPLDSAETTEQKLGVWDRECPLCFRVWQLPTESDWNYDTIRCPWCDHREDMRWTPNGWIPNDT